MARRPARNKRTMPAADKRALSRRAQRAWSRKQQWDNLMRDVYEYSMPQRDVYDEPSPGQQKGERVFDSTAVVGAQKFANRLVNRLFPPFTRWCELKAGPGIRDQDERDKLNELLEAVTESFFAVLHSASNFQSSIGEFALDYAAGTGCMIVQKGSPSEPVRFVAVPQIQVALEEGPHGSVSGIFRRWRLPLRQVRMLWPRARLGEHLEKLLKDDSETTVSCQESTYLAFDPNEPEDETWRYAVMIGGGSGGSQQTGADGGVSRSLDGAGSDVVLDEELRRNPWVTARFAKAANEVHGRGPLVQALPDVKTINKLVELVLKNATLAVSGPYTVSDDGVITPDNVRIAPGSFIPVARNAGHPMGASIAPLERSGSFDVAYLEYERIQSAIKTVLLDEDLPPVTGQPRTAAEILERIRRLASDLGATFGRIIREVVLPVVQTSLDILIEDWNLIALPDKIRVDGFYVTLAVTSPLAREQNLQDVEAIVRTVEISNALFGPELTALAFKVEDIPGEIADLMGMPKRLVRDEQEREALQMKVAQSIAAMQQQQQAMQGKPNGQAQLAPADTAPREAA